MKANWLSYKTSNRIIRYPSIKQIGYNLIYQLITVRLITISFKTSIQEEALLINLAHHMYGGTPIWFPIKTSLRDAYTFAKAGMA